MTTQREPGWRVTYGRTEAGGANSGWGYRNWYVSCIAERMRIRERLRELLSNLRLICRLASPGKDVLILGETDASALKSHPALLAGIRKLGVVACLPKVPSSIAQKLIEHCELLPNGAPKDLYIDINYEQASEIRHAARPHAFTVVEKRGWVRVIYRLNVTIYHPPGRDDARAYAPFTLPVFMPLSGDGLDSSIHRDVEVSISPKLYDAVQVACTALRYQSTSSRSEKEVAS